MDYDDIMFSDYATPHIMSLVTDMDDPSLGLLGTLEVSVRMDETFPELFTGTAEKWTVLTDENGTLLAGNTEASDDELRQLVRAENETQCLISGKRVLVAKAELKEIGCTYLQVTDLSDIYRSVFFSLYPSAFDFVCRFRSNDACRIKINKPAAARILRCI